MMDQEKIMQGMKLILEGMGEDVNRPGLIETPQRIARMYEEIFAGMEQDASVPLSKTFPVENNEMVIEKDITFSLYSSFPTRITRLISVIENLLFILSPIIILVLTQT